jgi:ADP-ribosylglycohydrolase/O-acetyl-ADP-ribose deacetylase (regulator of RNase III)
MRRGVLRVVRRRGDVSDDTQLLISVARSIDPWRRYQHERFLDELRLWYGYRVAAGRACTVAARRLKADPGGSSGVPSEGNGAAMRVAPLAVAHAADAEPEALLQAVEENARATHTAPQAVAAAKLVALLVWHALRSPRGSFSAAVMLEMLPRLSLRSGFTLDPSALHTRDRGSPSGHVGDSIRAVLRALAESNFDFPVAMGLIFRAGGDADTVGAIAGAVIGAQVGLSGLPSEWVRGVQHGDYIQTLADRLCGAVPPARAGTVVEVEGDVATRPVEAVVNAWNRNLIPAWLLLPQGVSRAVRRAGGREIIREISRRGPMPLGAAWETTAGKLPARWVVHVAGIDLAWRASSASVRWSTRNALLLARCLGASSVALPLIGAGSGGLPVEHVRAWMLEEMHRQRESFDVLELVSVPVGGPARA